MAYNEFEPRVFPLLIFYFFISAFGILITINMFLNYRKKENKAAIHLSLFFAFLTTSIIVLEKKIKQKD